ncbi:MAG: MaoC family dehydratase N-terminal domain-containing protein [Nocardioidaceae bacterium]|nr:MaoC family dehydratase N-terminal domain-containing protein [Nocardioidaceae bacterium]
MTGRSFAPTTAYSVSREKIAEFTAAIGAEPLSDDEQAPLTFPIVIAFQAMTALMNNPDVGIQLSHVIHVDQRFEQSRPVRAGDRLAGTLTIDSLRRGAGVDMISTRTEVTTTDGDHVATAFATLAHREGPA